MVVMVSPIEDLTGGFGARDGLFELTPTMTKALSKGCRAAPGALPEPVPEGVIRLDLPRWDQAWQVKQRRGGWPKVDPNTGKVLKHRPVWDTLRGNSRYGHYAQRHKATKEVIDAVVAVATKVGLVSCRYMEVTLVWSPGSKIRADEDNLWPLLKASCDALARGRKDLPGLHLVPDDDSRYMRKSARIDRPPVPAGLWLEVVVS